MDFKTFNFKHSGVEQGQLAGLITRRFPVQVRAPQQLKQNPNLLRKGFCFLSLIMENYFIYVNSLLVLSNFSL